MCDPHVHFCFAIAADNPAISSMPSNTCKLEPFSALLSGSASHGDPAKKFAVDVTGVKALRLDLEGYLDLGEVMIFKNGPPPKTVEVIRLTAPINGSAISDSEIELKWTSVTGATAYGIEIVNMMTSEVADDDSDRIWAFTAKRGATTYKLSTKGLPPGKFRWTVIPYNKSKVIGGFASEFNFTIKK